MFGTNDYLSDFKQYLVGMNQTINRGGLIYIYATSDKSMIVLPRQATSDNTSLTSTSIRKKEI